MIKFIAKDDQGNQTLGLGIVAKNVENLKKNMPIVFNLSEIGSPKVDSICIFYGEDEKALLKELKGTGIDMSETKYSIGRNL